ncbi:MAG: hypothetical protein ACFFCI_18860 [Promethearchaeota archaeon]
MDVCIFCNSLTSFKFEDQGKFNGKPVCPKCQTERFNTNFNTSCASDDECSIKIKRDD